MIAWNDYLLNVQMPPSSIASSWDLVKDYRLLRLQASDVAVLRYTEAGLAVPPEWLAYRQALRDITTAFSDPADVVFPDPPDLPFPTEVISQDERVEAVELMIDLILDTQEIA